MPSFSSTPARSIEPAVGASVWASGSQVWNGTTGVLITKAMAKPRNNQRASLREMASLATTLSRSKLVPPLSPAWANTANPMIDTSMKAEPNMVNRKNLVAA